MKSDAPTKKLTKFWCKTCYMPLCPDICYDEHRKFEFMADSDNDDIIN